MILFIHKNPNKDPPSLCNREGFGVKLKNNIL